MKTIWDSPLKSQDTEILEDSNSLKMTNNRLNRDSFKIEDVLEYTIESKDLKPEFYPKTVATKNEDKIKIHII